MNTTPFKIYDASAGSGKTFTLVRNYIAQLLLAKNTNSYQNILAITFTNKAVAEMKSRIISSLRAFSAETVPQNSLPLFQAVAARTGLNNAHIQRRSRLILKRILHNYAGFEISTIDSFTHRILRTFAKDLNIPMNFDVQVETDEILQEAVDRLIAKAGKDKALTKALIDYAISKADDDKSWDIAKDLYSIAKLLTNENNFTPLEQLRQKTLTDFSAFEKSLHQQIKMLKTDCHEISCTFMQLLNKHELEFDYFSRSSIPNFFQKIINKNFDVLKTDPPIWQTKLKQGEIQITKKKTPLDKQQLIDSIQPEITALYNALETRLFRMDLLKIILNHNTALSLLSSIEKEVSAIKEERGILLISEFNKKISENIKDQPSPFIYERLGERYHTFYIDEFQDTSVLQWENITPLIENSLAMSEGRLTLVGDAKQSIYRWRGGRAEQFMALCGDANPFPTEKHHEILPDNYRSLPEVVNFNNELFTHAAEYLSLPEHRELYEKAAQHPKKTTGGYVNIEFIEAANDAERNEIYPKKVAAILQSLKAQLASTESKTDNAHLNGVCILVRKKKHGIAIANYLSAHKVPIISSETLLLKKSKPVLFLVNLLQYALSPNDSDLKYDLLYFLYDQLQPEETEFKFIKSRLEKTGEDFFRSLQAYEIDFSLRRFSQLPFYDALEYSLRSFKLVENADAYIQFFLDFVYDYTQKHSGGISGFLELWALKKEKLSIIAPEGENAVQIMTIHKAKGLEFPTVIYPYANSKSQDTQQDNLWISIDESIGDIPVSYVSASKKLRQLSPNTEAVYEELLHEKELDTLNVAYVALTRAEQQLYILSELEIDKNGLEKTTHFSGLLISYLKKKQRWDAEQTYYEFGEKPKLISPKEDSAISAETHQLSFISSAPQAHAITMVTRSGEFWGSPQEQAIEEGNLIHNLLKEVYLAQDIPEVISKAVSKGLLLEKEVEKYTKKLQSVAFHPSLAPYFSSAFTVYTEKEIITNQAFKRLDRLCITANKAVILDYKTGQFRDSHQEQVDAYAKAIEEIGYQVDFKLLIYLGEDTPEIRQIA